VRCAGGYAPQNVRQAHDFDFYFIAGEVGIPNGKTASNSVSLR
jgi:hypothetical protein